jgi:hypothetical protein
MDPNVVIYLFQLSGKTATLSTKAILRKCHIVPIVTNKPIIRNWSLQNQVLNC